MKEAIKIVEEMIDNFEEVSICDNPKDEGYYQALKNVRLALRTRYIELKRKPQASELSSDAEKTVSDALKSKWKGGIYG